MSLIFGKLFSSNLAKRSVSSLRNNLSFLSLRKNSYTSNEIDAMWADVADDELRWPQIPKEGIGFRIVAPSGRVIKPGGHGTEGNAVPVISEDGSETSEDQYFHSVNIDNFHFEMHHATSDQILIVGDDNGVDIFSTNNLEAKGRQFTLHDPAGDKFMIRNIRWYENSPNSYTYWLTENPATLDIHVDQVQSTQGLFRFQYEPYDILDVMFDEEGVETLKTTKPQIVAQQVIHNLYGGTEGQQMSFTHSKEISESKSFTHALGAAMELGMTFTGKIPFVAETELAASISGSYDFTWGEETSTAKASECTLSVNAGPNEIILAQSTIYSGSITMPYKMLCRTRRSGICFKSEGSFQAVSAYGLTTHYKKLTEEEFEDLKPTDDLNEE